VFGKAAGPELDQDGQICDPTWLGKAMPKWYEFGNVRAQHQAVAAGIGTVLDDTGGGKFNLKSLVVDSDSKEKVLKKVYKGYSIGIKNARVIKDAQAPKGRIVDGDIVEISLVDRPSNPTARLSICKAAGGAMAAVDMAGEVLWVEQDLVEKVLSGDLHKSLTAMDAEDAQAEVTAAIDELADTLIAEAETLKAAMADGESADVGTLLKAARALSQFVGDGDSDGLGMDIDKALGSNSDSAIDTLLKAEITKAVAEAKAPIEEQLKLVQADLAKAMAAPRSGGPVLLTQPTAPLTKSAEADRFAAIADRTADPELALAYRAAAEKAKVAA
jgi:hypothetical protein